MDITRILVHLDSSSRSAVRLGLATELAARHGAHVIGLYVAQPDPGGDQQHNTAVKKDEFQFQGWLRRQATHGEWRAARGSTVEVLTMHGRCTDLIVIGQHDPEKRRSDLSEKEFVKVLGRIGRPVLAVPYVGSFASVGERILVWWDGGPESTRAMNEALPLLRGAKVKMVLTYNSKHQAAFEERDLESDIVLHLERHGVMAKVEPLLTGGAIELGDALLSYAADFSADLIVSGAVIRSRVHELMFGGATRTLIRRMTVPLLLST